VDLLHANHELEEALRRLADREEEIARLRSIIDKMRVAENDFAKRIGSSYGDSLN
jgi:hypothetical protein